MADKNPRFFWWLLFHDSYQWQQLCNHADLVTAPGASNLTSSSLAAATACAVAHADRVSAAVAAAANDDDDDNYSDIDDGNKNNDEDTSRFGALSSSSNRRRGLGGGDRDEDSDDESGNVWGHASRSGKLAALAIILPIWRAQVRGKKREEARGQSTTSVEMKDTPWIFSPVKSMPLN